MLYTIVVTVYIVVWGIVTTILVIQKGDVPAEYWSLPAIGLGAILAALSNSKKNNEGDSE